MKSFEKARNRTARGGKRQKEVVDHKKSLWQKTGRSSVEHKDIKKMRTSIDCHEPKPKTKKVRIRRGAGRESPDFAPWSYGKDS